MRISDWSSDVCSSDLFDWHLPDDDATTIAGLVLHEAQMIPDPGQVFVFHGFRFEILRRHRHQITLLKLTPIPEGTPASSQRSEEHKSELQSLMRTSYAVFCLKKKNKTYYSNHERQ